MSSSTSRSRSMWPTTSTSSPAPGSTSPASAARRSPTRSATAARATCRSRSARLERAIVLRSGRRRLRPRRPRPAAATARGIRPGQHARARRRARRLPERAPASPGGHRARGRVPVNGRPTLMIVDNEATRAGIRLAIADEAIVCAEAADAETAIRAAMRTQPDLCLVGSQIPGGGVAAVRGICRAAPRCAAVVLAPHHDVDEMIDAVRAGAVGYVPGTDVADRLQRIVRAVAANEAVVPRSMVLELLLEMRNVGRRGRSVQARVPGARDAPARAFDCRDRRADRDRPGHRPPSHLRARPQARRLRPLRARRRSQSAPVSSARAAPRRPRPGPGPAGRASPGSSRRGSWRSGG